MTFAGRPKGFVLQVYYGGSWLDLSNETTRPLQITRASATEPSRMNANLWLQGGGLNIPDLAGVRVYDPYTFPGGLYPRYFNGLALTSRQTIGVGNINQEWNLDCVGFDWLWKNPPARLSVTLRVGAAAVWLSEHVYSVGDTTQPYPSNGHKYTIAAGNNGTSGTTQPTFNTGTGSTTVDGTIIWTESGSSLVSDQDVWMELLPIFFPNGEITYDTTNIHRLIASVPSFEVTPSMTPYDVAQKLAESVTSTSYYDVYSTWAASHAYSLGDEIEQSPSVHGLIFQVTDFTNVDHLSGSSTPPFTSQVDVGAVVADFHVIWTAVRRTGKWEPSCQYAASQRIEPDGLHLNGLYYDTEIAGTTASTPPTWTGIGTLVTSGSAKFRCMGSTNVAPILQAWTPSDDVPHTAPWTPYAAWFDTNTETQTVAGSYSDQTVEDATHFHYSALTINREGTGYANKWYVEGRNASQSIIHDQAEIDRVGITVSKYYSDTSDSGPANNNECRELAYKLLALSIMRETVQLTSPNVLDPIMIQKLTSGLVVADLLSLNHTYPFTSVSVTLGLGAPVWEVQGGAGFLTERKDIYSQIRGGRRNPIDQHPPALVEFETDPGSPNFWVLQNSHNPLTGLDTVAIQWTSGQEANLESFTGYYRITGEVHGHAFPSVPYPTQHLTLENIAHQVELTFYIAAYNRLGQVQRNPDGSVRYAISPPLTTVDIPTLGSPTSLAITSNQYNQGEDLAQIGFSWVAPADPNSLGITGYKIVKTQNGISTTIIIGVTTAIYLLFLPGLAFSFTINAIDSYGHDGAVATISGTAASRVNDVLYNPSFEDVEDQPTPISPKGWALANGSGTALWDSSTASDGTYSVKFTLISGAAPSATSDLFRVVDGSLYHLGLDAKSTASDPDGVGFQFTWYDAAFSTLGTTSGIFANLTNSWTPYDPSVYAGFIPLTGSRYARLKMSANSTSHPCWVDNLRLREQIKTTHIMDSAITKPKLFASGGSNGTMLMADSAIATAGMRFVYPGVALLTNKSGASVAAGDVVVLDLVNVGAFTTTTSNQLTLRQVGVAQETIANNAIGAVTVSGYAPIINLRTSASIGDYVHTSTSAKLGVPSGTYLPGDFCQTLGSGTTPAAWLFGWPGQIPFVHAGTHGPGGTDVIPDLDSGTSFPGSPSTNRRFFRTDLGVVCYYDGTRWLGPEVYLDFSNYLGSNDYTANTEALVTPADASNAFLVTRFDIAWHVFTTNDVSNYWGIELRRLTSGVSFSSIATLTTSGGTHDTWTHGATTSFTNNPSATSDFFTQINVSKTGSPGNMRLAGVKVRGHIVYT